MELPTQMKPGPKIYFLASYAHGLCNGCVMWYRPNACGYTPDIKQAAPTQPRTRRSMRTRRR